MKTTERKRKKAALFRTTVRLFAISFFLILSTEAARPKGNGPSGGDPTSLKPEVLGAKAFLEDLLIRRYSQELGTRLEKGFFTVGAELSLSEIPKPAEVKPANPDDAPPTDLLLGTLDPDELIKRYASDQDGAEKAQSFLKGYKIRSVSVSVGIKEELGPTAKTDTEKWLSTRIRSEFGKIGKGAVTTVNVPILALKKDAPPAPPKAPWDRLDQFQHLAGQIALALAILLGAILFALLSKKQSTVSGTHTNTVKNQGGETQPGAVKAIGAVSESPGISGYDADAPKQRRPEEITLAIRETNEFTQKLNELMPSLAGKYERVIQAWCESGGEDGKLKIAGFAEAVGRSIGRLPIPADSIAQISKLFATTMPSLDIVDKRDLLKKVYWDILAAHNLGAEAFDQPFDYLGSLNVGVVQQALLEQNPRLKTLVTLFMPSKLREDYLNGQSKEAKLALISSAARLSSVPSAELKSFDQAMRARMLSKVGGEGSIPLEMSLGKLVSALTPIDEIRLLSEASSGADRAAFDAYKRSSPSLAFLGDWEDDKLKRLFAKVTPDEIVAYLRVMPNLAGRFLPLCPPMTGELAGDELRRADRKSETESNQVLGEFNQRLMGMIVRNELNLAEVFAPDSRSGDGSEGLRNVA